MDALMNSLQGLVTSSGIGASDLAIVMIAVLFGLMVVGLVLGQELAFVLGGVGVVVGWIAWGDPGVTIAMTKIYDQKLLHGGYPHVRADGQLPDILQGGRRIV